MTKIGTPNRTGGIPVESVLFEPHSTGKNAIDNRIHKEGFDEGYKKGYEMGVKDATARMTLLSGTTKTYGGNGGTGVSNGIC